MRACTHRIWKGARIRKNQISRTHYAKEVSNYVLQDTTQIPGWFPEAGEESFSHRTDFIFNNLRIYPICPYIVNSNNPSVTLMNDVHETNFIRYNLHIINIMGRLKMKKFRLTGRLLCTCSTECSVFTQILAIKMGNFLNKSGFYDHFYGTNFMNPRTAEFGSFADMLHDASVFLLFAFAIFSCFFP